MILSPTIYIKTMSIEWGFVVSTILCALAGGSFLVLLSVCTRMGHRRKSRREITREEIIEAILDEVGVNVQVSETNASLRNRKRPRKSGWVSGGRLQIVDKEVDASGASKNSSSDEDDEDDANSKHTEPADSSSDEDDEDDANSKRTGPADSSSDEDEDDDANSKRTEPADSSSDEDEENKIH